jgi:hypothetical protein
MDINVCFILAAGILAVALLGVPLAFPQTKRPVKQTAPQTKLSEEL